MPQIVNIAETTGLFLFLYFFGMHIMKQIDAYMGTRKRKIREYLYILKESPKETSGNSGREEHEAVR